MMLERDDDGGDDESKGGEEQVDLLPEDPRPSVTLPTEDVIY